MQNMLTEVNSTIESIAQINQVGMAYDIVVVLCVISFVVSMWSLFKKIDKRIDARIDERIRPSLDLLEDTVQVVKSLEKNTAEMNATLTILRDILLHHNIS